MNLVSPLRLLKRGLDYIGTYLGLLYLVFLCLSATIIIVSLFRLFPMSQRRVITQNGVSWLFRCYLKPLSWFGLVKVDAKNLDLLSRSGPLVVAPNHPALIDAVLMLAHMPRAVCFMKASIMSNPMFGPGARAAGYVAFGTAHSMIGATSEALAKGEQLLIFPESTRTVVQPVNQLSGMFALAAKQAQVPVQLVFIETDSPFLGKHWPLWKAPSLPVHYRIRLGEQLSHNASTQEISAQAFAAYAEHFHDKPNPVYSA